MRRPWAWTWVLKTKQKTPHSACLLKILHTHTYTHAYTCTQAHTHQVFIKWFHSSSNKHFQHHTLLLILGPVPRLLSEWDSNHEATTLSQRPWKMCLTLNGACSKSVLPRTLQHDLVWKQACAGRLSWVIWSGVCHQYTRIRVLRRSGDKNWHTHGRKIMWRQSHTWETPQGDGGVEWSSMPSNSKMPRTAGNCQNLERNGSFLYSLQREDAPADTWILDCVITRFSCFKSPSGWHFRRGMGI